MHRVDTKKRRSLILRYVAYSVTLVLTIITTVILLFVAQGYRLDRKSGQVVRSGLLLVNNIPEAGQVYINGELKDSATPSRFVLPAGNYELSLERQGYRGWKKQVSIVGSGVEEVYYPWLIPKTLSPKNALDTPVPAMASQSLNRKTGLTYITGENQLHLIKLDAEKPTQTPVVLPSTVQRESGQLGGFTVIEWALDNKHVLLDHTLPSGAKELLSLDVTKPEEVINLTALYGDQTPADVHYRGGDTDEIYGVKDGVLSTYQLSQVQHKKLLERVRRYKPYSDDTIAFARANTTATQVESGLLKGDKTTVVRRADMHEGQDFVTYGEYDGHFYFATASGSANNVIIYRDPLKTPILKSQLPYATLLSDPPLSLELSSGSEFLLAQSGNRANIYDFEHVQTTSFNLPHEAKAELPLKWLDNWRLTSQQPDGMAWIVDYDGNNSQTLVKAHEGTPLWLSDNFEHAYRFFDLGTKTTLDTVSLVVDQP